jgi:hypothetical protein
VNVSTHELEIARVMKASSYPIPQKTLTGIYLLLNTFKRSEDNVQMILMRHIIIGRVVSSFYGGNMT